MRQSTALRALICLTALTACTGKDPAGGGVDDGGGQDSSAPITEVYSGCDPVAPTLCGLPFPSTYYMREDAASATGWRIDLQDAALPINNNGGQPTGQFLNERDGWSVSSALLAHFPGVDLNNLVGHDRIGDSLLDDSHTVLIDVETGERVAHWVERDVSIEDGENSLLMIHPAGPLDYGRRYVVGLRGLVDSEGNALPASDGFVALRDGTATQTWDTEGRRALYDEVVFPALEAQGWDRGTVTLAWDFVTGSKQQITGRASHISALLDEAIPEGPAYTIDLVETAPNEHIAFRVTGTMTVPLFTDVDDSGALLTRGDDGMPYINGETSVPFTINVPRVLVDEGRPGPLVQYGHGLLGGQGEVNGGYLAELANRYGYVLFAVDWTGMKSRDVDAITLTLVQDMGRMAIVPERSQQGFAEFSAAMKMMVGPMVDDPVMQVVNPESGATVSVIDPDRRYYYGNSQGAILGGAYAAISPMFERAVLGVGGGPYQLLLTRSHDFEPFFLIFKTMYPDPKHITLWLSYIQVMWDEGETAGYAKATVSDPLPGVPVKTILHQVAIGDAQVTTLGAEFLARGHQASLIGEPVRPVWGLPTVASTTGSALVEWDYGLDEPYVNHPPAAETDPHELPRRELAGQEQLHHFFSTGEIKDFCGGPCRDLTRFPSE
jgi:hypothetical protein